jgi:hypothetical protein
MKRILEIGLLLVLVLTGVSCAFRPAQPLPDQTRSAPRIRFSTYATDTIGTNFTDVNQLGTHNYESGRSEQNGIIYTCRGGHIDIAHLRKAADWTAYLAERTYLQLIEGTTDFNFKLYEPSIYHVHIEYPDDWSLLPAAEKKRIAQDVSIDVGGYFSHVGLTWHEILTWHDYSTTQIYPQNPSAFSWEDSYSNTLGEYLAVLALRDSDHEFDEAMTLALQRELASLGPQSEQTSKRVSNELRGRWYTTRALLIVRMRARNLDIGSDDNLVSPWLAPSVPECPDPNPKAYPVQSAEALDQHGIKIKLEIEPEVPVEREILQAIYPDGSPENTRIEPKIHFPAIMAVIRQEVAERYGNELLDGPIP